MKTGNYSSESVEETREFGRKIAYSSSQGDVFALIGELGTGKTEFVRGFTEVFVPGAKVRSPSFPLIVSYKCEQGFSIHHFDFYRLDQSDELFEIGYYEYIENRRDIVLIEWAEMFSEEIPEFSKRIEIRALDEDRREIRYTGP